MDVSVEKGMIRRQKKAERDALTENERTARSHAVCEALWRHPLIQEAQKILCYAPIGSETDIWELLECLWAAGKRLAFPRVYTDREGEMDFFEVSDRRELTEGAYCVPEPEVDGRAPVDWNGALILVPGVAFDASGMRCGYGKGYYDRYFARHPELVRVGVAFECQLSEELSACCEKTDERLDYVQTERCCYQAADALSYEELTEKISTSRRFGRAPGIECSASVMELLGRPQRELKFVHIAGTNGKGSVAAFLREICEKAGLRAGLFTSPHLQEFTERIQIGHAKISREKVLQFGKTVIAANHMLMVSGGMSLTMFDYCLAIALLYFREQCVDLVILETGMGGRLDSTNIIQPPLVSVITAIGLEHTAYLGDTIAAIASEKAGILKHGTRAVLMEQEEQALDVLKGRCEALSIPYRVSGSMDAAGYYGRTIQHRSKRNRADRKNMIQECKNPIVEDDFHGFLHFNCEGTEQFEIGMLGAYQRKNAAAAVEAARLLAETGFAQMTQEAVVAGIRDARWQGRMELVSEHPWVLLDGAHNVPGVTALAQSLRELGGDERYVFFMGVMSDKDYEAMVELILPLAKHIYALEPDSERALSADRLCALIRDKGGSASVCADTGQMIALVRAQGRDEKCVVFGSLYLIGEVRALLVQT